jgi:hypothetical protein
MNNAPSKTFKKYVFQIKKIEKQTKIVTHRDLWKYGSILTIQKSLTIKWLRFSKIRFLILVYHLIIHHTLSRNNNFGMWINIIFFILWCSNQMTNPYFSTLKVHSLELICPFQRSGYDYRCN